MVGFHTMSGYRWSRFGVKVRTGRKCGTGDLGEKKKRSRHILPSRKCIVNTDRPFSSELTEQQLSQRMCGSNKTK